MVAYLFNWSLVREYTLDEENPMCCAFWIAIGVCCGGRKPCEGWCSIPSRMQPNIVTAPTLWSSCLIMVLFLGCFVVCVSVCVRVGTLVRKDDDENESLWSFYDLAAAFFDLFLSFFTTFYSCILVVLPLKNIRRDLISVLRSILQSYWTSKFLAESLVEAFRSPDPKKDRLDFVCIRQAPTLHPGNSRLGRLVLLLFVLNIHRRVK